MKTLLNLWNELSDLNKKEFVRTMEKDIEDIKFRETHRVVGDEEAGTSFIVPIITFDFPMPTVTDGTDTMGGCTRLGTVDVPGDCLSSELCPYCSDPPKRFLKGYDCYD